MPKQRRPKKSGLPVISLFSGAGGMDAGFSNAGFDIRIAVDNQEPMCLTHRRNFPETIVIGPPEHTGDLRSIDAHYLLEKAGLRKGDVALVVGGPPCQPFSIAANQRFMKGDTKFKRKGFADRRHGNLIDDFVRIVCELRPEVFCLENVPGLTEIDSGRKLQESVRRLERSGYVVKEPVVVEAADYGVPQFRKRLFLLGSRSRGARIGFPIPMYGHDLFGHGPYRSVAHALVGLNPSAPNHEPREHKPESIVRYRKLKFGEREHLGRVDRLDPRRPSKTVIAGGNNGGGRSHLHPYIARTLTVRECARLQSFDDDFVFEGPMGRQFTQAGNAVPPLLAEHLARHIARGAFELNVSEEIRTARYLERPSTIDELCEILLQQSIAEKPEWSYDDVPLAKADLQTPAGFSWASRATTAAVR